MTAPSKTPQKKIARRITPDYLHNAALYYLERYAASTGRVRRILTQKIERSCRDHPDQNLAALLPLIDVEIATLTRVELLQDERLATQFVEGYRGRGLPARMITQKLQLKGFDAVLIKSILAQGDAEEQQQTERDAAKRYLIRRKLWPHLRVPAQTPQEVRKAQQKAWAALARQGYSSDVIDTVMTAQRED